MQNQNRAELRENLFLILNSPVLSLSVSLSGLSVHSSLLVWLCRKAAKPLCPLNLVLAVILIAIFSHTQTHTDTSIAKFFQTCNWTLNEKTTTSKRHLRFGKSPWVALIVKADWSKEIRQRKKILIYNLNQMFSAA